MSMQEHWQAAWDGADARAKSWYEAEPAQSLDYVEACAIARHEAIIDVGGGASTLVDALLARGFENVTVLDIAQAALQGAQARLGDAASRVKWLCGDATAWQPPHPYRLWHDRAVFHFLTEAADRKSYRAIAETAIVPGGHLIIATFAEDGPQQCSGLPVRRYSAQALAQEFAPAFVLEEHCRRTHTTPSGAEQRFQYCRFLRL